MKTVHRCTHQLANRSMQGNLVRTQLIIRFLDLPKERSAYGTAKTMFVLYEKAAASLRLGMHRNNKK